MNVESLTPLREQPDQLIHIILEQNSEIEKLHHLLRQANKNLYGTKSEKLLSDSLSVQERLFDFAEPSIPETTEVTVVPEHTRVITRGRKPLPDLPRERIEYEPADINCSCCGKQMSRIGEETTEELEFIPAKFFIKEHVRIKRACSRCKDGVQTGVIPPSIQPLERARPGSGLLSHILLSKYCDHLPLYRQEQIFSRAGIQIPRQRMCDWIEKVVELLMPVYEALHKELLKESYLLGDETTIKIQDGKQEGKCHLGYFWGLHAPPKSLVWFHYAPTRASTVPEEILKEFEGFFTSDAYAGYNSILLPQKVERIACMAHIRRKFIEVRTTAPKECDVILQLIAKLYKIEEKAKKFSNKERQTLRQKDALPVVDKLFTYLKELTQSVLPRHLVQKALSYALAQETPMRRYLTDGRFHIDNNAMERQIRPIALGRKNYLFAGSHDGAKRAAVLYSLIGSCKLSGVNPFEYLCDVLQKVHTHPASKISEILPHRWKKDAIQVQMSMNS